MRRPFAVQVKDSTEGTSSYWVTGLRMVGRCDEETERVGGSWFISPHADAHRLPLRLAVGQKQSRWRAGGWGHPTLLARAWLSSPGHRQCFSSRGMRCWFLQALYRTQPFMAPLVWFLSWGSIRQMDHPKTRYLLPINTVPLSCRYISS
jgi:hypothetical protein